eukprot:PhM_4_TR18288/c0_g1_i1/m.32285
MSKLNRKDRVILIVLICFIVIWIFRHDPFALNNKHKRSSGKGQAKRRGVHEELEAAAAGAFEQHVLTATKTSSPAPTPPASTAIPTQEPQDDINPITVVTPNPSPPKRERSRTPAPTPFVIWRKEQQRVKHIMEDMNFKVGH